MFTFLRAVLTSTTNVRKFAGVGVVSFSASLFFSSNNSSNMVYSAEKYRDQMDWNDHQLWMCDPVTEKKELAQSCDGSKRHEMEKLCMSLQGYLCRNMERIDGKAKFFVDKWSRKTGGGGISCVMSEGDVFEKAGINISSISGILKKNAVMQMKARIKNIDENKEYPFSAVGISCVIHPKNPHVPTMHFNFRYFEADFGTGKKTWWFGGGTDLTPYYLDEEDAKHFHQQLRIGCDAHDQQFYPKFKKWCDDYFFIQHRGERRGLGGIFFDDLNDKSQDELFAFVQSSAQSVAPSYLPIVEKHKDDAYGETEREWQLLRRGRYVEFNLVYDRGTKFGLHTPEARIESILISLPLYAKWIYCHDFTKDPRNVKLMEVLKNPRDWLQQQ